MADPTGDSPGPEFADGNVFGVGSSAHAFGAEALAEVTPQQEAARRTADAVRRLILRLSATSASITELEEIATAVDAVTDTVPEGPLDDGITPGDLSVISATAVRQSNRLRERSPFIGRANPVAPPMHVVFADDAIEATVTLGSLHEGPPGCVHGGFVAALFDEVLGAAQVYSGRAGMTGRLTVHYRSPTPLHQELRLAARLVKVEGRKILCTATLHAGERLCAEAEGLFVTIDLERVRAMLEARPQD
ncbi:MAG: PaaI family thioesterase [Actinobacteria bacterium]|nr:PaaI family thioesterase [Actinomycetota bacterium]